MAAANTGTDKHQTLGAQAESIIGLLYHGFVLRDVFGKALPGAVLLGSLVWLWDDLSVERVYQESFKLSLWQWGAVLGITWLLGLVSQTPGLVIESVVIWKRYGSMRNFYSHLQKFSRLAPEDQVRSRIRLTLLYEASINIAVASAALSGVAFYKGNGEVGRWVLVLVLLWLFCALVNMWRAHEYQDALLDPKVERPCPK